MNATFRKVFPPVFGVIGVVLAALACTVYLGGPEPPGPEITPVGDAQSIQKTWSDAVALSPDKTVVVVFSEAELTAYLQQKLEANPNNSFHSAQVFLRDGRIQIYGILSASDASASAILRLRPDVTDQGKINFVLEQAQVGPLNLPAGLLSAVSDVLTEAFTGQVGPIATGFLAQEVLVGDGQIAIRGILR
ncbi:MAG: hypothetical protein ABSA10_10810 [Anaerolineales bacterium]